MSNKHFQNKKPVQTLEQLYPGINLYNDVVSMLKEVCEPNEEVRELLDKANPYWDNVDYEKKCRHVISYFKQKYPLLYRYNKNIFEKMILQEKRVDKEPFIKFLKLRAQISQGQINNDQFEDQFGKHLAEHYMKNVFEKEEELKKHYEEQNKN